MVRIHALLLSALVPLALGARGCPDRPPDAPSETVVVVLGASTSSDGVVGVGETGGVFDHPLAWTNRLQDEHPYDVRRLGFDPARGRFASGSSLID